LRELQRDELWKILTETAKALPMYKNHKRFTEDVIIKEKPDVSPRELSIQLNIPYGEALVILKEVKEKDSTKPSATLGESKSGRTLLDFSGR